MNHYWFVTTKTDCTTGVNLNPKHGLLSEENRHQSHEQHHQRADRLSGTAETAQVVRHHRKACHIRETTLVVRTSEGVLLGTHCKLHREEEWRTAVDNGVAIARIRQVDVYRVGVDDPAVDDVHVLGGVGSVSGV